MFGDLAVICRAGALTRRGEIEHGPHGGSGELGLPDRARSRRPAPSTAATCSRSARRSTSALSGRTNEAGIAQLRALLAPRGWDVVERAGHEGAAPQVRRDRSAGRHRHRLRAARRRPGRLRAFLGVPEEHGAAVVVLDERTVLMSADAPRTAELFAARGLRGHHRRHQRVREARGLRDLPVGAHPRLTAASRDAARLLARRACVRYVERWRGAAASLGEWTRPCGFNPLTRSASSGSPRSSRPCRSCSS